MRGSRHRVHLCFYIYFLKIFIDFRPYGCTKHHYVLDLHPGFCCSLATPKWINYYIVFIQYLYEFLLDLLYLCAYLHGSVWPALAFFAGSLRP